MSYKPRPLKPEFAYNPPIQNRNGSACSFEQFFVNGKAAGKAIKVMTPNKAVYNSLTKSRSRSGQRPNSVLQHGSTVGSFPQKPFFQYKTN